MFGTSGVIDWLCRTGILLQPTLGCERPNVEKSMLFFTAIYARADGKAAGATLNGGKPQLTCKRTKF
jgi:hypothetical protein